MPNKLSIGVWGLGPHAKKNVIPAILKSRNFNLYGICTSKSRDDDFLKSLDDVVLWNNHDEMLNDSILDAIYISTPIALHYSQILQAIKFGKHVICEKPFTNTLQQSRDLIYHANLHNVCVMEAMMYLYGDLFLYLSNYLKNIKEKIQSVDACFTLPPLKKAGFRYNNSLGGSCFFDVGCYPVSLIAEIISNLSLADISGRLCFDPKLDIDISGFVQIITIDDICINLRWSYDHVYTNRVQVRTLNSLIDVNKLFYKSHINETIISVYKGEIPVSIKVPPYNAFITMLDYFYDATLTASTRKFLQQRILNAAGLSSILYSQLQRVEVMKVC